MYKSVEIFQKRCDGGFFDAVVSLRHQRVRSVMLLSRELFLVDLGIMVLIGLTCGIGNNVNKEVVVSDPCLFEAANESNLLR